VQLDPGLVAARQSIINFHLIAPAIIGGSKSAANEHATEIQKRDAVEGCRAFASIHIAAKRTDLARKEYEQLIKKRPRSARARDAYGVFLMLTEKNYAASAHAFHRLSRSTQPTCRRTFKSAISRLSPETISLAAKKR
jgi:hypothetical protein